uniref:Ribosomal protein L2 n=1 Tax=Triparma laevis TaxID=1534972 RepID=A0A0K2RX79_9STRA|nr:ribosomal protein L2 [Triparma laevis]BAS19177.1 ribosomal protein L2 [Triparma laevis]
MFKKINPTTPSQRQLKLLNKNNLNKFPKLKNSIVGLKNSGGRNNLGRITSFKKGGGHKKSYRIIDFSRHKSSENIVISIEHDPNRSSHVAGLYNFEKNIYSYILAPAGLQVGHVVKAGNLASANIGHCLKLSDMPIGSFIHNISALPNKKGQFVRAAGGYAQLIQKNEKYARVVLSSGEHRLFLIDCVATMGIVSNENQNLVNLGKAGRSRWLNKRPTVRGVAMNPIDHPHGGGEGKTSGGRPAVSPWGRLTKGKPTVKTQNKLVVLNRKKNKKK